MNRPRSAFGASPPGGKARSPAGAPPRRRALRGFTLVELLVALFVLALMAGMAWQGVDLLMRSRDVTQQRLDRLLRLQSVLAQWEADLRQVTDTQVVPALGFDGASLRLTRLQGDGVQLVVWTLRGSALTRWTAPVVRGIEPLQEAFMRSHQLLGDEAGSLAALDGLSGWQLYYYDQSSSAWRNAQSSGDVTGADEGSAPPAGDAPPPSGAPREALPDGVRLVLELAEPGADGTPATITRDLRLLPP